jgi:hypothetical protein
LYTFLISPRRDHELPQKGEISYMWRV